MGLFNERFKAQDGCAALLDYARNRIFASRIFLDVWQPAGCGCFEINKFYGTVKKEIFVLPNLIIIGAMKCGTTSLHEYLDLHPDIYMSRKKETNFFIKSKNWPRGLSWYESNFDKPHKVMGESSPNYSKHPQFPDVPERMYAHLPNAKLLYCVRDPIDRIVSHYIHDYSRGRENRSFSEAMANLENNRYVSASRYYLQLQQYLKYYSSSNIKVVTLDQISNNRLQTLQEIFEYLEVDPTYADNRFDQVLKRMPPSNQRRRSVLKSWLIKRGVRGTYWVEARLPWLFGPPIKRPEIDSSLRQKLIDVLSDDTNELRRFTGYTLDNWSV